MNSFEGSFLFENDNLRSTDLLGVERAGPAIARLYVVDAAAAESPIPAGLSVFDITNNVNVQPVDKSLKAPRSGTQCAPTAV
ncbi:hypothetical protein HDU86_004280 [Geranomyces michiganensis]|nr:hypothetical protein HDU86_004280 [Geranomyces michiganensis]